MSDLVTSLARQQLQDYRRCEPGTYFSKATEPLSMNDAYRVAIAQCGLREADGEIRAGYKVGGTSPEIFKAFGIRGPVFGFIYDTEIYPNNTGLRASNFQNLSIEAEMAVTIGDDLELDKVFPIIELHNLVFNGAKKTLQELVANNCLTAGTILPDDRSGQTVGDCAKLGLRINGKLIEEGQPWSFPDGPAASVNWLKSALAEHDLPLNPGDIVLVGTSLGIHEIQAGDKVEVLLNDVVRVQTEVYV